MTEGAVAVPAPAIEAWGPAWDDIAACGAMTAGVPAAPPHHAWHPSPCVKPYQSSRFFMPHCPDVLHLYCGTFACVPCQCRMRQSDAAHKKTVCHHDTCRVPVPSVCHAIDNARAFNVVQPDPTLQASLRIRAMAKVSCKETFAFDRAYSHQDSPNHYANVTASVLQRHWHLIMQSSCTCKKTMACHVLNRTACDDSGPPLHDCSIWAGDSHEGCSVAHLRVQCLGQQLGLGRQG